MTGDSVTAFVNAFGPFVAVGLALIWVILRSPSRTDSGQPGTDQGGFDAKQKLYLREHLLDPIMEAINRRKS